MTRTSGIALLLLCGVALAGCSTGSLRRGAGCGNSVSVTGEPAAACSGEVTCGGCTGRPSCGWCHTGPRKGRCTEGSELGPVVGSCPWDYNECTSDGDLPSDSQLAAAARKQQRSEARQDYRSAYLLHEKHKNEVLQRSAVVDFAKDQLSKLMERQREAEDSAFEANKAHQAAALKVQTTKDALTQLAAELRDAQALAASHDKDKAAAETRVASAETDAEKAAAEGELERLQGMVAAQAKIIARLRADQDAKRALLEDAKLEELSAKQSLRIADGAVAGVKRTVLSKRRDVKLREELHAIASQDAQEAKADARASKSRVEKLAP